ncbi:hypothetical protein [Solilutibacter pythonis]|uniref:hypothetical protein n=1 Tax=Solilutibacter pythonis TaxID=2483112 RepID=UPI0011C494B5|nr:hypothetical protein [Lysobacter pythonis]
MKDSWLGFIKILLFLASAGVGFLTFKLIGLDLNKGQLLSVMLFLNSPIVIFYFFLIRPKSNEKISGNKKNAAAIGFGNIILLLLFSILLTIRFNPVESNDLVIGSAVMLMVLGAVVEVIVNYYLRIK